MNATDSLKAMVGTDAAKEVRPDLPARTICFNKLPVLEITSENYLDITALWATCPALASHTWRRVTTGKNVIGFHMLLFFQNLHKAQTRKYGPEEPQGYHSELRLAMPIRLF